MMGDLQYIPPFHSPHKPSAFFRPKDESLLGSFISTAAIMVASLSALAIIELFSPKTSPAETYVKNPIPQVETVAQRPAYPEVSASAGRLTPTESMKKNARAFTSRKTAPDRIQNAPPTQRKETTIPPLR